MSGVETTGFVSKTLAEILAEIEASEKGALGSGINLLATSVLGQLNGIMAGQLRECWEVLEAVYSAAYPDSATAAQLESVASITGASRLPATYTTMTVGCTGTAATALAVGQVISTGATDRFVSTAAATITAATAWGAGTVYAVGAIRSNDNNIYVCVTAGTSAGAGGPTGTADAIADNTCVWNFVGDGLGYAAVPFRAEELGTVAALADAIDTEDAVGAIETPVAGWSDARNLSDGTTGREIETDAAFRVRREGLLAVAGSASASAVRADVLAVSGVNEAFVFVNSSSSVDADGIPPNSFEVVVSTTPVDAGAPAWLTSSNAETYSFADGQTLIVAVDGGAPQTATFNLADFVSITEATAAEVAVVLNADITGITAFPFIWQGQSYVMMFTGSSDITSSIEVTGGTEAALGFPESPVVAYGVHTAIRNAIYNSGAAGVYPHGTIRGPVVEADSIATIALNGVTEALPVPIYMAATLTTDSDYPTDGDDQVKAALVALGGTLSVADDVIYERFKSEVFSISGVTDVTAFTTGIVAPAVGLVNIDIGSRSIATFSSTDITIT